jgi:hypothetical protein
VGSWLPRRTLVGLIGVLLVCGAWEGYGRLTAADRMTPAVRAAVETGGLCDVVVELTTAPEQFHIKLLQSYGTVSGVGAANVVLQRVPAQRVAELARFYWVARIELRQP